MTLMKTSEKGIALIKAHEGLRLSAYRCAAGIWTIGWGHTDFVRQGMTCTADEAEKFLKGDIEPAEKVLNKMGINYTQGQFDALVSWIFNLGVGNFNTSTMKKYIVAGRSDLDITDQMVRWTRAGGKELAGLKKRRVAEANMFLGREEYYLDVKGEIKRAKVK